jgi:plasmid stabilization system protein ParE
MWWATNRPHAPKVFAEDLEAAFRLAQDLPNAGEPFRNARMPGIRRILLGRVQYHLYYQVLSEDRVVKVLALWHTSRGSSPRL